MWSRYSRTDRIKKSSPSGNVADKVDTKWLITKSPSTKRCRLVPAGISNRTRRLRDDPAVGRGRIVAHVVLPFAKDALSI
jgi:hypothetical protein